MLRVEDMNKSEFVERFSFDSLRGPTFSISGKSRQKRRQKPMVFEFPFRDYTVE